MARGSTIRKFVCSSIAPKSLLRMRVLRIRVKPAPLSLNWMLERAAGGPRTVQSWADLMSSRLDEWSTINESITVKHTHNMGSRLSQPRGPGGTTESSAATKPPPPPNPKQPFGGRTINRRTIVAPVAAFTMACLLFVYARTSIRAAKSNAQRHREADGGRGLDLLSEHRRRHGLEQKVDDGRGTLEQLAREAREQLLGSGGAGRGKKDGAGMEMSAAGRRMGENEATLRALKGDAARRRRSEEG